MRMKPWLFYSLMTLLCWGLWGVFSKLASNYSRPRQTLLFQAVGVMAFALVVLFIEQFQIQKTAAGFGWSFAAGFVNFVGFLAFFAAVQKGKVSTVISLSSLYPVITIALSVLLLHEKITRREGLGIAFAITACWLLAG
jgi:bacterial/archaeal transporter family protein